MLCTTRDDVLEEGVNVWYGEETPSFKPKFDVVLVHGLGSHPYWAWLHHEPSTKVNRASSGPGFCDSAVSLIPPTYRFPKLRLTSEDAGDHAALLSSPDFAWTNEYSTTDVFGNIGTFWPRDLLPLDARDVRICTVGYRSQWTSSKFRTSFKECGDHLLNILVEARGSKDAQTRPIIFIAHSFGGLVVQSALVSARMDDCFSTIRQSAAGCLFLGSPMQGTSSVAILNMATTLTGNHQDILDSLRPGNRELWTLQDDFLRAYPGIPTVCFYEKLKTGLGRTMMVVPESAACIPGVKSVGLQKDHLNMNKFKSSTDESYVLLRAELKTMMKLTDRRKTIKRGIYRLRPEDGEQLRTQVKRLVKRNVANLQDSQLPQGSQLERSAEQTGLDIPDGGRSTPQCELEGTIFISNAGIDTQLMGRYGGMNSAITKRVPEHGYSPASVQGMNTDTGVRNGSFGQQQSKPKNNAGSRLYAPMSELNPWTILRSSLPRNLPAHLEKKYQMLQTQLSHCDSGPVTQQMTQEDAQPTADARNVILRERVLELPASSAIDEDTRVGRKSLHQNSNPLESSTPIDFAIQRTRPPRNVSHAMLWPKPTCDYPLPHSLQYLRHIEQKMDEIDESTILTSRKSIFDKLTSREYSPMPENLVALFGPLGIGKTYIAMAYVHRLGRQAINMPIFWVAADSDDQLEEDCEAITALVGLKPQKSAMRPWEWMLNILRQLSIVLVGPWLMILDGVHNPEIASSLSAFCDANEVRNGYVLLTTRHLDIAERFLGKRGLGIHVGTLEPCYAADLLAMDAPVRHAGIFDELAQCLDYDPFAITKAKAFLTMTKMPLREYLAQLTSILNRDNWMRDSDFATTAADVIRCAQRTELNSFGIRQISKGSVILAIMLSCLNPSWFTIFDQLNEKERAANELLAVLSVLGRTVIPERLVNATVTASSSTKVLLQQSFLAYQGGELKASQLMLTAHRIWLAARQKMEMAFAGALRMLAYEYPDAASGECRTECEEIEPFANAATSIAAKSWTDADDTNKWCRVMLFQKRAKFYRLCTSTSTDAMEMENLASEELRLIQHHQF